VAGVTRVYVYRFTPPGNAVVLATAITKAGELVVKHNKNVEKVDTVMDGDDMLMRLTVKGHDQWWIKKNIVYPVAGILTRVGIKVKDVKLDAVERPPDSRSTRPRASDGRSTPDPDKMIDHSDMGLAGE
jgi:hypothetical protein